MRTQARLFLAAAAAAALAARGRAEEGVTGENGWFSAGEELSDCIALISSINSACPCSPAPCSAANPRPTTCDAGCAEVFLPFYEQCEAVLRGVDSMAATISGLEPVYAICSEVDLGATSGVCPLDGTWATNFDRNLQIRGAQGSYLGEWGGLYDIAWTGPNTVEGTFHNNNADRVGRFIWTFGPAAGGGGGGGGGGGCADEQDGSCLGDQQAGWQQFTCAYAADWCTSNRWGGEAQRCCPNTCNTCPGAPAGGGGGGGGGGGAVDCSQFSGQWGWELDSTMNGAWNGQRVSGDTPLAPDIEDGGSDAANAAQDLYAFRTADAAGAWQGDAARGVESDWEFSPGAAGNAAAITALPSLAPRRLCSPPDPLPSRPPCPA